MDKIKVTEPHWYEIHITECVACFHHEEYRIRRRKPKPNNPYKYKGSMCYSCMYGWA